MENAIHRDQAAGNDLEIAVDLEGPRRPAVQFDSNLETVSRNFDLYPGGAPGGRRIRKDLHYFQSTMFTVCFAWC